MIREIRQIVADRWDIERKRRAWMKARRQGATATVDTRQGRLTVYTSDDVIGRLLYTEGQYECDLMASVVATLRQAGKIPQKGGIALDIGANIGLTAIWMLTAGEFEHVLSFEPEPRNFKLLSQNLADNGCESRVTPFNLAVSNVEGLLEFELSEINFGDHRVRRSIGASATRECHNEASRKVIQVPARPLDRVLDEVPPDVRQGVCLMWIDIQGHEGLAFRGADQLLRTGVPAAAELWPYGLERAGTTRDSYCALVREYWSECWAQRGSRFIRYPIAAIGSLWDEFAPDDGQTTVLLTR